MRWERGASKDELRAWAVSLREQRDRALDALEAERQRNAADLNSSDQVPGYTAERMRETGWTEHEIRARTSDCCSGFVTQEGREIHQAIEHEPEITREDVDGLLEAVGRKPTDPDTVELSPCPVCGEPSRDADPAAVDLPIRASASSPEAQGRGSADQHSAKESG